MKTKWSSGLLVLAVIALVVSLVTRGHRADSARAADDKSAPVSPRYRVVETEGHNLIVTDNKTETLYFYSIDRDAKIGSELHLRGQIDLKQVGKKVIRPENVNLKK
jgi:hypothetical protein